MPTRVDLAVSGPGAPLEPQRTRIRIGLTSEVHGLVVRAAAERGFMAQEALELGFEEVASHRAVPTLITGTLDVAVLDVATFIGERSLGWDGLAIAAFGPVAVDRSMGLAVVESRTWSGRRDACQRLWRAAVRALAALRADHGVAPASEMDGWWDDCRPSADELSAIARWEPGPPSASLATGLAWSRPEGDSQSRP